MHLSATPPPAMCTLGFIVPCDFSLPASLSSALHHPTSAFLHLLFHVPFPIAPTLHTRPHPAHACRVSHHPTTMRQLPVNSCQHMAVIDRAQVGAAPQLEGCNLHVALQRVCSRLQGKTSAERVESTLGCGAGAPRGSAAAIVRRLSPDHRSMRLPPQPLPGRAAHHCCKRLLASSRFLSISAGVQ